MNTKRSSYDEIRSQHLGTSVIHFIRLFSPRTLFGLYVQLSMNIDFSKFYTMLTTVFIPLLILRTGATFIGSMSPMSAPGAVIDKPFVNRLSVAVVTSPFFFGSVCETAPVVRAIYSRLRFYKSMRRFPDDDVWRLLDERVRIGRVRRKMRYDLYLPPISSNTSSKLKKKRRRSGLIFLPGGLIHHAAYASIAARLSDHGLAVAVMSMEPLRLAASYLGADPSDIASVMEDAASEIDRYLEDKNPLDGTLSKGKITWSIGGHSMGGYAALALAPHLLQCTSNKIVLWAVSGSFDKYMVNLSSNPQTASRCQVLVILGSLDPICNLTPSQEENFKSQLPSYVIQRKIKGGNHSGFASYPQITSIDGPRKISLERQHEITCRETVKFLMR